MSKRIAILQSNYIPWKGYFDIINMVDEFIIYDEVQYTKDDWRNRNLIKTSKGTEWLSIPVDYQFSKRPAINTVRTKNSDWVETHLSSLREAYKDAPFFNEYKNAIEGFYHEIKSGFLSEINIHLIKNICALLNINTKISLSQEYESVGERSERLLSICKKAGANSYLSGPAAKSYLDESLFTKEGIEVLWMNYDHYPEYKQLHGAFEHHVSILDLIFNTGPEARKYLISTGHRVKGTE